MNKKITDIQFDVAEIKCIQSVITDAGKNMDAALLEDEHRANDFSFGFGHGFNIVPVKPGCDDLMFVMKTEYKTNDAGVALAVCEVQVRFLIYGAHEPEVKPNVFFMFSERAISYLPGIWSYRFKDSPYQFKYVPTNTSSIYPDYEKLRMLVLNNWK